MAINVPTVQVGTGKQVKVVEPVLLTGLDPNGDLIPVNVDASGNLVAGVPAVGADDRNKVSVVNSNDTPLLSSTTFIGEWEDVTLYDSMILAINTDQNGIATIEFSTDGANVDSSLVRYYRTNQIEAPSRFTITRKYLRVKFFNESATDQTVFRLQVILGFKQTLNAPLDSVLAQDYDANVTRPSDFACEVALGLRQGVEPWNKFGYNTDLGLTSELISSWSTGPFLPMVTASTLSIVSTSTADFISGTGAHSVTIYGIDATRASQIETIILTGTTPVVTTTTWLGINRIVISDAGSSFSNVGDITANEVTGGTPQAVVPAGEGTTQQCIFYVQRNHKFLMNWMLLNVNRAAAGGADPVVTIIAKVFNASTNTIFEVFRVNIDTTVGTHMELRPGQPFTVGGSSVFWLEAASTKTGTFVSGRFSGTVFRDVIGTEDF